ncbi:hypothetical protein [Halobellus rubicundus]|uniref:Adhesin domain-containing protein n=1 Tax=Halobellus rubicundus TaxID=2996466 RepID=A0ABD5MCM4_9EURY
MQRSLQYIGLSLVILGAMLTIVPTGSFSTIAGDRPVDVAVAGDSEAFIAIDGTNNVVTQPGSSTTVAELENNLDSGATVQYEASVSVGSLSVANPSETVTIPQGGTTPIEVSCVPPKGGAGTATLTIDVIEAESDSATITGATLEAPVEYDCPGRSGGGPPDPGEPPGDAIAYIDGNEDLSFNEGDQIVEDLASFDNDSAALVIAGGGETIDFRNAQVDIEAKSVVVDETTLKTNKQLKIEADDGTVSFRDSTIDTKNGQVDLKAKEITASGTTITSNKQIKVESESEALTLTDSTVDSKNGQVELKGPSVDASGSTVTTNKQVKLSSESGALTLTDATVDSKNGQIKLKGYPIDASGASITTNKQIDVESESGTLTLTDSTVDSKNGQIKLKSPSIDADRASITTNKQIKLTAESGALDITDATIQSKNGQIELKSNAELLASGAVIDTNKQIKLTSSGDMTLDNAEIRSKNGEASLTLNQASATLAIDGAVMQDRDSTVVYSPSGITVNGTPAQGSVQAG